METQDTRAKLVQLGEGTFVERDVLNVVEKVAAYDPNLKIQYRDGYAQLDQAPYRLMELCRDGIWREVFPIWKLDETVLERLYQADTLKHDIQGQLEYDNKKAESNLRRRYDDRRAQEKDWLLSYLRSRKGRWSFKDHDQGKIITLDDTPGMPVKVKETD